MNISKLQSFERFDKRFNNVRTGDIAISTRDDTAGIFITYFTFSLYQHSAIFAWVDRDKYENGGEVCFKANNEKDDILTFAHITKRRMYDLYTNEKRSGLVLCTLDDYCKHNLITVWNRPLSKYIDDATALNKFNTFIKENTSILEYENDIRTILGVPLNITYHPHPHRMICTTMVCFYLETSYGYPFLILDNDETVKLEEREIDFVLPSHRCTVYKAKDFKLINNQSPVLSEDIEHVVYGSTHKSMNISTFHPVNIVLLLILLVFISLIVIYIFMKSKHI